MRIIFEEDVRALLEAAPPHRGGRALSCLLDLHLPGDVRCEGCESAGEVQRLTPAVAGGLRDRVLQQVDEHDAGQLDLVLFGGEPLLDARHVLALSSELQAACVRRGVGYAGHLITNGALLDAELARGLARAGLARVQVTLEGGLLAQGRRRRGGAESWRRALAGLRCARKEVALVLRLSPDGLEGELAELLAALDHAGDLAGDDGIVLYVARTAAYPQQARELAALSPLLDSTAAPAHGGSAARA